MSASMNMCRKYLLHFANEHVDFRFAELKSIIGILGHAVKLNEDSFDKRNPFVIVELPSDDYARSIMRRTMLIKSVFELFGQGFTHADLYQVIRKLNKEVLAPYIQPDKTFRLRVDTYNKSLSAAEKLEKIEALPFDALDFQGKANMKNPDNSFHLLEYYGPIESPPSQEPSKVYFGRWIADGQRDLIKKYHLQNRHFIGNTSMDAGLSLVMANMGQAKKNKLIFDPFVGTGSLLVACAHHEAYVMGTDLDYLLVHGRGKSSRHNQKVRGPDENIRANLRQYDLEQFYMDAVIADASVHSLWRKQPLFDAIITDPPYGIREGAKKVGTQKEECVITDENKAGHVGQKIGYHLSDIFKDLLNFAATYLRLHGRLVYWFPVYKPDYDDDNIPCHPILRLIANCEQPLSMRVARRLITMEKVIDLPETDDSAEATIKVDHHEAESFREKYFSSMGEHQRLKCPQREATKS